MLKNKILSWVRRMGWMPTFDKLYFLSQQLRFKNKNLQFKKNNPGIQLPPEYMLYESYRLDYEVYFADGKDTALWLSNHLKPLMPSDNYNILEWGCGPARVVRHLPSILPFATIHATDYNAGTIAWCKQHITGVQFSQNLLSPPLHYPDQYFDAVYALSVLTHLSSEHHQLWINELYRILCPNGILLLTTQGNAFISKLSGVERKRFTEGKVVIRSDVKEGHRSFSAFQPESFMQSLFENRWKVVKFEKGIKRESEPEQDTWILQKINKNQILNEN